MVNDSENLQKFKKSINKLPRDTSIVIYCGCCPFDRCPDVRPAVALLKEMKFTNFKLLNLPDNIKTDWISKGYPQVK
jgi:rhodanese-related sulfurtransferase